MNKRPTNCLYTLYCVITTYLRGLLMEIGDVTISLPQPDGSAVNSPISSSKWPNGFFRPHQSRYISRVSCDQNASFP